ncbi:FAD-dependent oxidoreductase [Virgibacillus senegalensis]|uniref:FAD-dependent oxidoreductase n=1 Tax=Virgibacillus senegalensis TaxID=1499679 RepID=UPI00069D5F01|nr:FAD-dependent oxidoreductase [Virgibacillus senegalensis]
MRSEQVKSDITVIGGGLAGVCASIAAARLGKTVSLVQNRPVLGGNSSSEVRVWVCGATKHGINRYARETGIMGELFVENQYRNPDGNPYLWDALILEKVKAEKNIQLFLNTDVHELDSEEMTEGERKITSVTGWMAGSERKITYLSEVYLDCTGDGLIGYLAGADYRIGREARYEFDESLAPEQADDILLGSTILFYTRDEGHPVKYVPPAFAKDITKTPIPTNRIIRSGDSGCHYWWIEFGGLMDTVHENEAIRDELWSVIYGIWDYIKNSGKFDSENQTLEWIGAIPGKREYRRFIGDYIFNQNDVTEQKLFEDRVAFGGWSIDLHPPKGMYDEQSGAKNLQADGNYHIPFRSLYSRNVANLLFAGRDISATHIAFGTTRVMATCAVIGEAAGTGAAFCVEKGASPRQIYQRHMEEMQQTLLRQDAAVLGIQNKEDKDIARNAVLEASSFLNRLQIDQVHESFRLEEDIAFTFPVDDGNLPGLNLLLSATNDTELEVEVWDTGKPQNYIPDKFVKKQKIPVGKGEKQWVSAVFAEKASIGYQAFVIVKANPAVNLFLSHQPVTGVLSFVKREVKQTNLHAYESVNTILEWSMKPVQRKRFCFRLDEAVTAYTPEKAINGYVRPYNGPNMWVSDHMMNQKEEWIQLNWEKAVELKEIHLTFNDDVNEDLINLHHHRTPFEIIPELVRDYRLEALVDDEWKVLLKETGNRKRKRIHILPDVIKSKQLKVAVESTNGCPRAEIVEIRVYENQISEQER